MKPITQKNNFIYLFFALLIFLFSAAIMSEFPGSLGQDVFSIVTVGVTKFGEVHYKGGVGANRFFQLNHCYHRCHGTWTINFQPSR